MQFPKYARLFVIKEVEIVPRTQKVTEVRLFYCPVLEFKTT